MTCPVYSLNELMTAWAAYQKLPYSLADAPRPTPDMLFAHWACYDEKYDDLRGYRVKLQSTGQWTLGERQQERLWRRFGEEMEDTVEAEWAAVYGLSIASGIISYRRLFGKPARYGYFGSSPEDDLPPCCDHTTLWRIPMPRPRTLAEVLVTQPYHYDLADMKRCARRTGLCFWISRRPGWHLPQGRKADGSFSDNPNGVWFIEWAKHDSAFAIKRREMDLAQITIESFEA